MEPPPPQRRGDAKSERLRSASRARTPGPSHSCAGGSSGAQAGHDPNAPPRGHPGPGKGKGKKAGKGKGKARGKGLAGDGKGYGGCAGGDATTAGGGTSGKGYGDRNKGPGGCAGGKGRAQHSTDEERHYKFCVAAVNLGGWTKRIRFVYEWNMWNMPAWIVLACEVDRITHEQLVEEEQDWIAPDDETAVQRPPQGFSSQGRVRRWVASERVKGLCVFGLAYRVQSLTAYDVFVKEQGNGFTRLVPVRVRWHQYVFDSKESRMLVFHLHNDHAQRNGAPRQGFYKALVDFLCWRRSYGCRRHEHGILGLNPRDGRTRG